MTRMPGYPCAVCRRQSGPYAISLPADPGQSGFHQFCSFDCARAFMAHNPATSDERKAAVEGGNAGGAYLDGIGKTDLASLTEAEWAEFCTRVFVGTCDALRAQADDEIPF